MKISDTMRDAITDAAWVESANTWRVRAAKRTVNALVRRELVDANGYLTEAGKAVRVTEGARDDENVTVVEPEFKVWSNDGAGWRLVGTAYSGREHAEFLARDAKESAPHVSVIITDGDTDPEATYVTAVAAIRPQPVKADGNFGGKLCTWPSGVHNYVNGRCTRGRSCPPEPTAGDQHRETERAHRLARDESWERSGMDGARTQYAHGLLAEQERLAATIADKGGVHPFTALFDLSGRMVPARAVEGQYGPSWRLLDANGRGIGWFNESRARTEQARRTAHARRGFYVGVVLAPATAELGGGGVGCLMAYAKRADGGYDPSVTVVDNGADTRGPSLEDAIRTFRAA